MKRKKKTLKFRNYMHLHVQQTTRMQIVEDKTKYNRKREKDKFNKQIDDE